MVTNVVKSIKCRDLISYLDIINGVKSLFTTEITKLVELPRGTIYVLSRCLYIVAFSFMYLYKKIEKDFEIDS